MYFLGNFAGASTTALGWSVDLSSNRNSIFGRNFCEQIWRILLQNFRSKSNPYYNAKLVAVRPTSYEVIMLTSLLMLLQFHHNL